MLSTFPCSFRTTLSHSYWYRICRALQLPLADSGPQHEPHAVHVRISPPGTSLRCSMNHAFKATAHENKTRRWQTFTPPQSTAHAAHCGLVLHWRAYQGWRGRNREEKEPDQGPGARQGGVALPHPETCLRIHQSALSRLEEESRVAMRGLRAGQPLPESQAAGKDQPTAGPSGGVVCPLEAARGLRRVKTTEREAEKRHFALMRQHPRLGPL